MKIGFATCALTAPDISKLFARDEQFEGADTRNSSDSLLAEAERVIQYQDTGDVAVQHVYEAFIQKHRWAH